MKGIVCVVFLMLGISAWAQESLIAGQIRDAEGKPVGFVSVSVFGYSNLKTPFSNALSDSLGSFKLATPNARHLLRFTAIGFQELKIDSVQPGIQNLQVVLIKDAQQLQNVDVIATRPTILQLPDRLVIGVQGTAMAAGNSAFSVLSKSPGVFVDPEGNIQLNGRGGVTIMIDGRLTYMSARDLRNLLESTSGENIKSIELITNPSAKYDAEGTSGIINIVFKKNITQGANGNVFTNYSTNLKQHFYGAGATVNYKSGRWNTYFMTEFSRRGGGRESTFNRVFNGSPQKTYFDQTAIANWTNIGPPRVRLGADFTINSKHSVGFIGSYTQNTAKSEFLTETYIGNAPKQPSQFINAGNFSKNTLKNLTTNLHYLGQLDSVGSTISVDLDYARMKNNGDADFINQYLSLADGVRRFEQLYTYTPNGFDVYSARLDLNRVISSKHRVEAGGRASYVESDNDSRFYFNDAGLAVDPSRTNYFHYTERITAGYVNWIGTLTNKLSVQAGLRSEHTHSMGESFTTGEVNRRDYLDWFPSAYIQYRANESYNLTVNYSRRINRPNYGSLNPFRSYRDPYTYTVGNPTLRPQYSQSYNVTQTIRRQYIIQSYYLRTKDVITELPMLDAANAVTIYTTGNVEDSHNGGVSFIIPFRINKWWDTRNTLQISYNKFNAYQGLEKIVNERFFYAIQSGQTFLLPKDLRAELNFTYRGPAASGLYVQNPMYRLDMALSKGFLKRKFEVIINITDLTKGWWFRWDSNFAGNINEFDQYMRWRTFGLTLRYNFSKGQRAELRQRTGPEELNRI